jgi:acetyltransferase-like isoleucine patch superfamily enzyme
MIAETAEVAASATVDPSTKIWDLAQVRENATIGPHCIIARGAYVGPGVHIGANSKIQNFAQLHEPAVLGDGVFIGPGALLTNDRHPRAVNPDGSLKSSADWVPVGVRIDTGASIGAGAICIAPVNIGAWAMVAAGAVVTKSVRAHALVAGSPAKQIGWVGYEGEPLVEVSGAGSGWRCPRSLTIFKLNDAGDLVEA